MSDLFARFRRMSRRNTEKRAAQHNNRRRDKQERVGFDPGPDRELVLKSFGVALSGATSCSADQVPRRATEVLGGVPGLRARVSRCG